ncbi:nucleotide binding protein [Dorcoceras hygrometricum]|uniref:Nucleotide binding protein n=1 Tax=Dorcoceras hygrometricum TaxID=472368 RepID=A0A2Z7BZ52_9LAMI|nr:nucleotide binding protein [Dorcoceras hygrometricum]
MLNNQQTLARKATSWHQTQRRNDVAPTKHSRFDPQRKYTNAPADHNTRNQTSHKRQRFRNLVLKHTSTGFATDQQLALKNQLTRQPADTSNMRKYKISRIVQHTNWNPKMQLNTQIEILNQQNLYLSIHFNE